VVDVAIREDGIHLCGDVASERDRSLARKIVEEELGRSDVVDRLRVDPCLWKRGEDEPRQGVDPEDAV